MIGLAKSTGDVTRNPITLDKLSVDHGDFWTSHFGGLYIFRDTEHPATISVGDKDKLGKLPTPYLFDLNDRNMLARFLELNDLVEPIVRARGVDAAAILARRWISFWFLPVPNWASIWERRRGGICGICAAVGREPAGGIPRLAALKRWVEGGGAWPKINSEHPAYFYTLRSKNHEDRDLVNQLLAELTPLDVRQLFICHKQLFYDRYATWPDQKKEYVANFLQTEYQVDKAGTREALYGRDDAMDAPDRDDLERILDIVGPWGAISGR